MPSRVVIFDCSSRFVLVLLDKVDRADRVVGQSMVDGLVEVAVIGEPCRRDAVEFFEVVGPVMRQSTRRNSANIWWYRYQPGSSSTR